MIRQRLLGARYLGEGKTGFRVWAPRAGQVSVHLKQPEDRLVPLQPGSNGYFEGILQDVRPGSLYTYRLDEEEFPDPASLHQPRGPHGPSEVVSCDFSWTDSGWSGLPLEAYILYELHVGTFTEEGTLEALIPHLDYLVELGITAVELMPLAQFPGTRNWGYDGTYPFAVQNSYGGPDGFRAFVDACHGRGLAVVLDVVYNHLGPEGNYLARFGHYFTNTYRTPWGEALNFDGPHSDEVRRFFLENAFYWLCDCHVDALRLDAVHSIKDFSATPFLAELGAGVAAWSDQLNRQLFLISESALNDVRVLKPREALGWGHDAQWNDDFHHSLRTLLTDDRRGYYQDFGRLEQLAKAFREGFVYSGQYSRYRRRRHGNSSRDIPAQRLVVFSQNHDQAGNRVRGERLNSLISWQGLKLAAGTVILSPFLPLLFMGEEYGEEAPFPYFVSHQDSVLVESVRRGRILEFAAFGWAEDPPDPHAEDTFRSARLRDELRSQKPHSMMLGYYRELIRLRKSVPALRNLSKKEMTVGCVEPHRVLTVLRRQDNDEALLILHFHSAEQKCRLPLPKGTWSKLLDSADQQWNGPGAGLPEEIVGAESVLCSLPGFSLALYGRLDHSNLEATGRAD